MQQPQQAGRRKVPIGILAGIGAGLILVAVAVAFFVLGRKSAGVPIDEAHFPDGEFRAWVSENADENGDGIITEVEAYKVIRIDVERVASVQGVENFPKVEEVHFTNSELTTLELTARELDVDIEVYGCEPGIGFAEHYLYEGGSGLCLADETVDYTELWFEDREDYELNRDAWGVPGEVAYEDLDDGTYRDGGFDESCSVSVEGWVSRHGASVRLKA